MWHVTGYFWTVNALCEIFDFGERMNLQILNIQQSIDVLYRINDFVWALIEDDIIFIRFVSTVAAGY